ncbi:MAG: carboxypeptidase-like regulatory domain-containing protein [Bacteroidales bacterium]|nr:carboxypeptidase-like regulatory domain-containing protein [Bacteroidales bacterium]
MNIVGFSQRSVYRSRVFDGLNFTPIEGVNVYNLSSEKFCFTDDKGNFAIEIKPNDTLLFSKSIYRQMVVVMTKAQIAKNAEDYFMYYKATMLKEVKVMGLNPSYEGFKRDVSRIKIDNNFANVNLSPQEKQQIARAAEQPNMLGLFKSGALVHPISYLYEKFSRKAKMNRLYSEMMAYNDELDDVPLKYNREIVSKITGLKDETELMNFMVYCRFGYYDIIRWSADEIVAKIKSKWTDYEYFKALEENKNYKK